MSPELCHALYISPWHCEWPENSAPLTTSGKGGLVSDYLVPSSSTMQWQGGSETCSWKLDGSDWFCPALMLRFDQKKGGIIFVGATKRFSLLILPLGQSQLLSWRTYPPPLVTFKFNMPRSDKNNAASVNALFCTEGGTCHSSNRLPISSLLIVELEPEWDVKVPAGRHFGPPLVNEHGQNGFSC